MIDPYISYVSESSKKTGNAHDCATKQYFAHRTNRSWFWFWFPQTTDLYALQTSRGYGQKRARQKAPTAFDFATSPFLDQLYWSQLKKVCISSCSTINSKGACIFYFKYWFVYMRKISDGISSSAQFRLYFQKHTCTCVNVHNVLKLQVGLT